MTSTDYEPGDIVWVKLSNSWWPGEVWHESKVPDDLSSLKKKPIAVVKFFKEDSYEYVKNPNCIYEYNCPKKKDFIRKGIDLNRSATNPLSLKFREDIITAEKLTCGDVNILENCIVDKHSPASKRPNIVKMIFSDTAVTNPKKNQPKVVNQKISSPEKTPKLVNNLRGQSIVTIKNIIKPFNNTPSKQGTPITPSTPSNGCYRCHLCSFTSMRQNVIILHSKTHLNQSVSSLHITSPRLSSENNRFPLPRPISSISKDTPVIVIDDDSDSDNISRTQTPQTVITTIDSSSDSQIIDVSLSPQESLSSSSSGSKFSSGIGLKKILPSRIGYAGTEKKKKGRGNKSIVSTLSASTPLKKNETIENTETSLCQKADPIPLIKPPKKQFRKGILKDIFEDWSDDDSSSPNNVKASTSKTEKIEIKQSEILKASENLGCSRLEESDVEVLKNLHHTESGEKSKSPLTIKKIRNIPKKDRLRNIILEEYSDSSNITPNPKTVTENTEILPLNVLSTVVMDDQKIEENRLSSDTVIEKSVIEESKETNIVQIDVTETNIVEINDSLNDTKTITDESNTENHNQISDEQIENASNNFEENNEIITQEILSRNEPAVTMSETNTINESNLENISEPEEKQLEEQIESPEFEPLGKNLSSTLSSELDKDDEIISNIEDEEANKSTENEPSTEFEPVNTENYEQASEEIYEKSDHQTSAMETDQVDENQMEFPNEERITSPILETVEESLKEETSCEKEVINEAQVIEEHETVIESNELAANDIVENEIENEKERTENANESQLENAVVVEEENCEEIGETILEEDEMKKSFGRSRRSLAQIKKSIGSKIRKSTRRSDNIYKYLGREVTTPSPIVLPQTPIYVEKEALADEEEATLVEEVLTDKSPGVPKITINISNHEIMQLKSSEEIPSSDENVELKSVKKSKKKHKNELSDKKSKGETDKPPAFLENEEILNTFKFKLNQSSEDNNTDQNATAENITEPSNIEIPDKPSGRSLRERKIRKEYAELDDDSLSAQDTAQHSIVNDNVDETEGQNLINEKEATANVPKSLIKSKKSSIKHNKTSKSLVSEIKATNAPEERELIPKLIIKSSKESGKESTLKVFEAISPRKMTGEAVPFDNSSTTNDSKMQNEKSPLKSPKKSPKKSHLKQKSIERKLIKKDMPEQEKQEKIQKEDTSAAVFDFQEEDDTELVLTSLTKLKKKFMSPDRLKDTNFSLDSEKQKEIDKEDEKLKAEIENLLNDVSPTSILTLNKPKEISGTDAAPNEVAQIPSMTDEVKALPIKERGKRFFKSRNISRNEELQPQPINANSSLLLESPESKNEKLNFRKERLSMDSQKLRDFANKKEIDRTASESFRNKRKTVEEVSALANDAEPCSLRNKNLEVTGDNMAQNTSNEVNLNQSNAETNGDNLNDGSVVKLLNESTILSISEPKISQDTVEFDLELQPNDESDELGKKVIEILTESENQSQDTIPNKVEVEMLDSTESFKNSIKNLSEDSVVANISITDSTEFNLNEAGINKEKAEPESNIVKMKIKNKKPSRKSLEELVNNDVEIYKTVSLSSLANNEESAANRSTDDLIDNPDISGIKIEPMDNKNDDKSSQIETAKIKNERSDSSVRKRRSHLKVTPRKRNLTDERKQRIEEVQATKIPKLDDPAQNAYKDGEEIKQLETIEMKAIQLSDSSSDSEATSEQINTESTECTIEEANLEKQKESDTTQPTNYELEDSQMKLTSEENPNKIQEQNPFTTILQNIESDITTVCNEESHKVSLSVSDEPNSSSTSESRIISSETNNIDEISQIKSQPATKDNGNEERIPIRSSIKEDQSASSSIQSKERKREKSITEQYEENFVERYMKDAGILLSSPNSQSFKENMPEADNNIIIECDNHIDTQALESADLTVTNTPDESAAATNIEENVETEISVVRQGSDVIAAKENQVSLIEQARAIVAKVNQVESLSDIRSFRPKRKPSLRKSQSERLENQTNENQLLASPEFAMNPSAEQQKMESIQFLLQSTCETGMDTENPIENENNIVNTLPTCPDLKILKAVDKLVEVQQTTNAEQTMKNNGTSPVKSARITVKSENPLTKQIANILASTSDLADSPENTPQAGSFVANIATEKVNVKPSKKRKLSLEEDIPTFIIDKNSLNINASLLGESVKDKIVKSKPEKISKKDNKLATVESVNNFKRREVVAATAPSQGSTELISVAQTDVVTSDNVFDINNLPILLTSNEELIGQENIQFVITPQPMLEKGEHQQALATEMLPTNTFTQAIIEPIVVPTAKKIRGRPRRSDPSLQQIATTTGSTGFAQTATSNVQSGLTGTKQATTPKVMQHPKGTTKKQQTSTASQQVLTTENSSQTYNIKPTSSRELGVDSSGNSIVLIQYGRNNQKLMKMPKTLTEPLQTSSGMENKNLNDKLTKSVETLQKPVQQISKSMPQQGSGKILFSNKGTIVQPSDSGPQHANNFINVANQAIPSNEVILTPIFESGSVAVEMPQQQQPQVQAPTETAQTKPSKKTQIQRTTYVGGESSESIIRQIQQQQHEQQKQKHIQHGVGSSNTLQRGRKRKEPDSGPAVPPNQISANSAQKMKQHKSGAKLQQASISKQPTQQQNALSSTLSSPSVAYDNQTKSQTITQIETTSSAITNQSQIHQQTIMQQQQIKLQKQQEQQQQEEQAQLLVKQQQAQQQQQLQEQQQQQELLEQQAQNPFEDITQNKISAVSANHFGIPGHAYYLCSQDNEGNYMPINNQELYLDPETNQLVPLAALDPKIIIAAAEDTPQLIDGSQQLILNETNATEEAICMEINEPDKVQTEIVQVSSNAAVASPTDNAQAVVNQQFVQANSLTADRLSNILSPDQSICINFDGQQLILDQASFLALVAAGGENTQLETHDGTILQLTGEFLTAIGLGLCANENAAEGGDATAASTAGNIGDESASGVARSQTRISLQTMNEPAAAMNTTDILTSSLIDDVLRIETSQGVQLVNAVTAGIVTEDSINSAFQGLTPPPVTAQTSETNALLTQPPIMSTLEVPSNKNKHESSMLLSSLRTGSLCKSDSNTINDGNSCLDNSTSHRIVATPQNLEDCIAFIGASTQSSTVPSSLELPITVTNPAIAPPKTTAPLAGLFNAKNLIVEPSQMSPQLVSSLNSDAELQLELFTTSSSTSSSSIGGCNMNNNINGSHNKSHKHFHSVLNNSKMPDRNNSGNIDDSSLIACNIEIDKFNDNLKSQQGGDCVDSSLNDFVGPSNIGSLSFEDPNR